MLPRQSRAGHSPDPLHPSLGCARPHLHPPAWPIQGQPGAGTACAYLHYASSNAPLRQSKQGLAQPASQARVRVVQAGAGWEHCNGELGGTGARLRVGSEPAHANPYAHITALWGHVLPQSMAQGLHGQLRGQTSHEGAGRSVWLASSCLRCASQSHGSMGSPASHSSRGCVIPLPRPVRSTADPSPPRTQANK